jgi:hypothetical protein
MEANKIVESVKPLSDEDRAKAFVKDYEALCDKHQMRVVTTPVWKARDDGTFSLVLTNAVGKLPQNETNR